MIYSSIFMVEVALDLISGYCSSLLPLLLERRRNCGALKFTLLHWFRLGNLGRWQLKQRVFWFDMNKSRFKHAEVSPHSLETSGEQLQRQPDAHRWWSLCSHGSQTLNDLPEEIRDLHKQRRSPGSLFISCLHTIFPFIQWEMWRVSRFAW